MLQLVPTNDSSAPSAPAIEPSLTRGWLGNRRHPAACSPSPTRAAQDRLVSAGPKSRL